MTEKDLEEFEKKLFEELEKFDDCLDYIEEFLKKTLCKNGCGECLLNHPTEQFPHIHCRFYEFIEDVAYIEDHIDLKEKEQEQKGKRLWNKSRRSLRNHENQTMHRIIYCFR